MITFQHEIEFTRDGGIFNAAQVAAASSGIADVTDLLVVSHGWNNDRAEATELYDALIKSLSEVIDADVVQGLDGRKFGVFRVLWPSKRFADQDLIPGGGAASATAENNTTLLRMLESMKKNPVQLGGSGIDPVREVSLSRAQALVPSLESDSVARRDFVFQLRSILDPSETHLDDGSEEFFTRDPEEIFQELQATVLAPSAAITTGAAGVRSGGAAGLGDFLSGINAAARRIVNYSTYYEMKQRAGTVGRTGLSPVLRLLCDRYPKLRLHLVGHSFGGRLVTVAAHSLPPQRPASTLSLLQAAFSHNGLGRNYDGAGHDGAFRALIEEQRVSGPIVITHTKNDRAIGIAYPLASRLSRDPAAAVGDQNDPYGGMGRNGAQHTPEADGLNGDLEEVGHTYQWKIGKVYNLKADRFIADHGDIVGHQVANAILNAIAVSDR